MAYAIPERTLARWAATHLKLVAETPSCLQFAFRYTGSTCSYGGIQIHTTLSITLRPEAGRYRIAAAEIVLLSQDWGLPNTCGFQMRGPDFLLRNLALTGVVGSYLDEYLTGDLPANPAGCFCAPEHMHHKWHMVLGTIAFFLKQRERKLS